jgi:beta-lactamase superfamily II metal-dependent hydrolase
MPPPSIAADARVPRVHLLDVGPEEYADAVLCQFGDRVILIDGAHPGDHTGREGHPSIPDQLRDLLHGSPPYHLDLLIVSHAHQDHIGCLPRLVRERVIEADWALVADPDLGWGRAVDEDRDARIQDERVRALVATLRDECAPLRRRLADGTLDQFMQDAANLEDTYRGMLRTLTERHTRVVRSGRDDIQPLQAALADVGLRVIGPSQAQALACADLINGLTHDAIDWATDRFARDATATAADVYRRIAVGEADAVDVSRPGPAVNLQSLTTIFEVAGHRFLFAGDMQLAKPQVSSPIVTREVKALRRAIRQRAPYSLVKLSHHGSDNAFSEELLIELGGTVLFGICAGEHSEVHPNPATLRLLHAHRDEIRWARTDRNGRVTMSFGAGTPRVRLSQGRINDERPNTSDVPVGTGAGEGEGTARLAVTPAAGPPARGRADDGLVEVEARIPHVETRVTITVDVTPGGASAAASPGSATARAVSGGDSLRLGGGRALPRLLFVTGSDALSRNIGEAEAALIRDAIRRAGMPLCDDLPDGLPDSVAAAERVRRRLRDTPDLAGVVLVGAHDVVPHQRLDCLPAALRTALPDTDDPDQFIVWSDEIYGDRDGDGLPELPAVGRARDGRPPGGAAHPAGARRRAQRRAPVRRRRLRGHRGSPRAVRLRAHRLRPGSRPRPRRRPALLHAPWRLCGRGPLLGRGDREPARGGEPEQSAAAGARRGLHGMLLGRADHRDPRRARRRGAPLRLEDAGVFDRPGLSAPGRYRLRGVHGRALLAHPGPVPVLRRADASRLLERRGRGDLARARALRRQDRVPARHAAWSGLGRAASD